MTDQNTYDEIERRARESARTALEQYKTTLISLLATTEGDRDHYATSITQVESAMRVLWMNR